MPYLMKRKLTLLKETNIIKTLKKKCENGLPKLQLLINVIAKT